MCGLPSLKEEILMLPEVTWDEIGCHMRRNWKTFAPYSFICTDLLSDHSNTLKKYAIIFTCFDRWCNYSGMLIYGLLY